MRDVVADLAEGLAEGLVVVLRGVGGLGLQGEVVGLPAVDEVGGLGAVAVGDVDRELELVLTGRRRVGARDAERVAEGEVPGLEGAAFGDGDAGPGFGEGAEVGLGGWEVVRGHGGI